MLLMSWKSGRSGSLFYPVAEDFKGAATAGIIANLIDHAAGKVGLHKARGLMSVTLILPLTLAAQRFARYCTPIFAT